MSTLTLFDVATWVSSTKMKRSDINPAAQDAAQQAYAAICSKVPFDELQIRTPARTLLTVDNTHDISDLVDLCGIMSIQIQYATNQFRRMTRRNTALFDQFDVTRTGRPFLYARFGLKLEFDRTPDTAYTIKIRYWSRTPVASLGPSTLIKIPDQWIELLRWETLYRTYITLERHQEAAALVQPSPLPQQAGPRRQLMTETGIIPRLWNDLCKTTGALEGIDESFGINPMVRNYTAAR